MKSKNTIINEYENKMKEKQLKKKEEAVEEQEKKTKE